jgi:hypothetical protein
MKILIPLLTPDAAKKLKTKKKRPSPTRVSRLKNFRAKPYEEKP